VGVHNNQPLAFVDAEGQAKGFLIDILEKEGWRLDYIPGSLTECLERLRKGEIDLAVGIEYSRERNKVYDFTYEDVFSDWGVVYTQEGSDINQIVNLDNKKIAVVHDDIHYHNIRNLAQQLKLKCRFVEAYEYDVVNRLYGLEFSTNYKINRSPIIFSHTEVHFVVPKKKHRELIRAIDKHLAPLKRDKSSIYHQSLDKWTPTNVKWQCCRRIITTVFCDRFDSQSTGES
jgi:ABC-type amino acid transport substrate-binding protein